MNTWTPNLEIHNKLNVFLNLVSFHKTLIKLCQAKQEQAKQVKKNETLALMPHLSHFRKNSFSHSFVEFESYVRAQETFHFRAS